MKSRPIMTWLNKANLTVLQASALTGVSRSTMYECQKHEKETGRAKTLQAKNLERLIKGSNGFISSEDFFNAPSSAPKKPKRKAA